MNFEPGTSFAVALTNVRHQLDPPTREALRAQLHAPVTTGIDWQLCIHLQDSLTDNPPSDTMTHNPTQHGDTNMEQTTTYVPPGEVVTEQGPPPYLKITLPITVRELRTLLDASPGNSTIGDASPFWRAIELGVYRGDTADRQGPLLRNS